MQQRQRAQAPSGAGESIFDVALKKHLAGQLAAAEELYQTILDADPRHSPSLHLLGVVAHQTGRHQLAVERIGQAIAIAPDMAAYHYNLGNALHALGQYAPAITAYRAALTLQPGYPEAQYNLGNALSQTGERDEAAACYGAVLASCPDHAKAHNNLGNIRREQAQPEAAAACYRRALAINPDCIEAHNNLGAVLRDLGRLDEAVLCYRRALQLQPDAAEAENELGNLLFRQQQPDQAVERYRRAVAVAPDYAEAHNNLGAALANCGETAAAVESYQQALAIRPDFAKAHYNLGIARNEQGQPEAAITCFRRAAALQPGYVEARNNLGVVLLEQGRVDEAIGQLREALDLLPSDANTHHNLACALTGAAPPDAAVEYYRRAAALEPSLGERHYNLAVALLTRGELAQGWEEHEWRWQTAQMAASQRRFTQPQWCGEPAAGRTLLIHAEQGFGDSLQFCRYATLAAARGIAVILEAPQPLVRLLARLPGLTAVVAAGEKLPAFDLHCPMLSLPRAFATTLADVPASEAYLCANDAQADAWKTRLAGTGPALLRIGLAWAGNPRTHAPAMAAIDRRRSIPPLQLAPLVDLPGCQFFSLQQGQMPPAALGLSDVMSEMADFADTAALIANLDLVISVDTAVAHLAAAMGKPVWLLDRYDACWRWLRGRQDSPWYPSLRIYRQPAPGAWDAVIADMVRDLTSLVQQPGGEATEAERLHGLGQKAAQSGQHEQAVALLSKAVTIARDDAACRVSLGDAFAALGRRDEAVGCYRRAAALQPEDAGLHTRLARLLGASGRHEQAVDAARAALAHTDDAGRAGAHNELALSLAGQGDFAAAVAQYRAAIALRAEFAEAHNNLGNALRVLARPEDALASYQDAISHLPDYAEAWHNRAIVLREAGRLAEALESCDQAIARRAAFPEAYHHRGVVLVEQGHYAAAIDSYRTALALQPDQPAARHSLGMALLATGALIAGWEEFEWRWQTPQMAPARRRFARPQWRGEPGEGRTLLIHAEQGFGDTIQFCRYARLAAARGWLICLEVPDALVRLLTGLAGVAQVVARGQSLPDFDAHCPMLSLPGVFATTLASIPDAVAYLQADGAQVEAWRARLAGAGAGRRIGLVWSGNPRPDRPAAASVDRRRSLPPELLAPLSEVSGLQFYSLQKDQFAPATLKLIDLMGEIGDFADTAALIANLDLVISVDTSVAHLAAALGKPVWLLDRFAGCWRWLPAMSDERPGASRSSPWYPGMRIYRQPAPGAWDAVITAIVADLQAWRDAPNATELAQQAVAHHQAGRLAEAETLYRRALSADPRHADSLHLLGVVADQAGRHLHAIALIGQAIAINPNEAVYHYNLGIALAAADRLGEAADSYTRATSLNPDYVEAHTNLGLALKGLGRLEESVASSRRAIALRPKNASAHNNLGIALRELGQLDEAVASYRTALAWRPAFPQALNNLGVGLKDQGNFDEAIACCRRALALDPDAAELHYNLATSLLTAGQFAEGWAEFEWRWQTASLRDARRDFAQPLWDGAAGSGERLLLHAEQGFGDSLQFCRYATLAAARGWRVCLEVPAPLVRLLRSVAGVDQVVASGDPLPEFAAQCPLLSLPRVFATDLAGIPATMPYLHADPALSAAWSARLHAIHGRAMRVGLVWAGNPRLMLPSAAAVDRRRSMPAACLEPLLHLTGVQFVSLQKDHAPPAGVADLMDGITDFADTAAAIANLDLVISVDTAVAHLAAALGKPVWLLDRFDACWRWLRGRRDSPWYPSLRIYRQPARGDWARVIDDVRRDLIAGFGAKPETAESLYFAGIAHRREGRLDRATDCYRRALALRPEFPEALANLGAALADQGQNEAAIAACRSSLSIAQDFPEAHSNLGAVLWDRGEVEEAIACYQRAIALKPEFPDALNNLGAAYAEQERLDEAREAYQRALSLRADCVPALNNLGLLERQQMRLDAAIGLHRRAVALAPQDADSHTNLALALLAAGDFAAGWAEYEWRWLTPRQMAPAARNFAQPQWRGEAAAGQTLLIHAEQGFGDTTQFCRYATLAARRGLRVILEAPGPLVRLLRSLDGVAEVVACGEALPAFDLHCPVMSLPLAFATTGADIPSCPGYLQADPALAAAWSVRLDALGQHAARIGLVWAGNARQDAPRIAAIDRRRSMPPEYLARLIELPGLQFFSLQKHHVAPGLNLVDLMDQVGDFADTAALIANLDLVISVDTAVAHVAASLGKPVWLLDRFDACWRWLPASGSRETKWYPSMRLYRQPRPGDWAAVIGAVSRDLAAGRFRSEMGAVNPPTAEFLYFRGVALARDGRDEDAAACYLSALRARPDFPEAHNNLGTVRMAQGQTEAALACYRSALSIQPEFLQARSNLGAALLAAGETEAAIGCYQAALAMAPAFAEAHHNLGTAWCRLGRLEDAAASFARAIAERADFMQAHHALATTLARQGLTEAAITAWRAALALMPDNADLLCGLGHALSQAEQRDEAIDCFRRAVAIRPDFAEAWRNLATALRRQGPAHLDDAIGCYREALAACATSAAVMTDLGTALWEQGQLAEATALHHRALLLDPEFADAYNNLGATLIEHGALDEAVACFRRALEIRPDFKEVHNNLGLVLRQQGHHAEGIACYHRSLALGPDDAEVHVNLGMALLADGDLAAGWQEYEWRWRKPALLRRSPRIFEQPQWRGESGAGRSLLIHPEQGYGDTLQFCRFAPLAAERGLRVCLEVQPPLARLLQSLSGVVQVVARGQALPAFDLHCPIMSLPAALGTTLACIPASARYLHADAGEVAAWGRRIAASAGSGKRVGLVWAGNPRLNSPRATAVDRRRSMPAERLAPLFEIPGVQFFSLQKAYGTATDLPMTDLTGELADFADTAALIANLDLVISVDTAVAHLAGALGKPVWLMDRFDACWRWLRDRRDSPWYPTLRIYRQKEPGDWDSVVREIAQDLRAVTARRRNKKSRQPMALAG